MCHDLKRSWIEAFSDHHHLNLPASFANRTCDQTADRHEVSPSRCKPHGSPLTGLCQDVVPLPEESGNVRVSPSAKVVRQVIRVSRSGELDTKTNLVGRRNKVRLHALSEQRSAALYRQAGYLSEFMLRKVGRQLIAVRNPSGIERFRWSH
jgi:hypothetical protein